MADCKIIYMELIAPYMEIVADTSIREVSAKLDSLPNHAIAQRSWPAYTCQPHVEFSIAYTSDALMLKYYVQEDAIRISSIEDNSAVHQDSCVEFFIAFDDEDDYYNFEFNGIGTALGGFGKCRTGRKMLSAETLKTIRRMASIKSISENGGRQLAWELTLILPFKVFEFHQVSCLKHRTCRVNFYKCGDEMPERHFLSWNYIRAEQPDFHQPEYFGRCIFQ